MTAPYRARGADELVGTTCPMCRQRATYLRGAATSICVTCDARFVPDPAIGPPVNVERPRARARPDDKPPSTSGVISTVLGAAFLGVIYLIRAAILIDVGDREL